MCLNVVFNCTRFCHKTYQLIFFINYVEVAIGMSLLSVLATGKQDQILKI